MPAPIAAVYETRCGACPRLIDVEDLIVHLPDVGWVHERCDDQDEPVTRNPTCPQCFIKHAGPCA